MSMAERWYQEGYEKGFAEGLVKGQARVLTKQLTFKFGELPSQVRERLSSAPLTESDVWAERVLWANSLDEVFA